MTAINFGSTVSLKQAVSLVIACPDVKFALQGEPGIGKSSQRDLILGLLPNNGADYHFCYFDCANKDLGDVVMPSVNRDKGVTEYFPNAAFGLQTGKKLVICLDEFFKAPQPIQNMLHPLLETTDPRLGDTPLPEGSIVYITSNLSSDGVGDNKKAHTANRIISLVVRKPNADEWLEWAVDHDIDPSVIVWVRDNPHALASYLDGGQDDNPYIFNPKKLQTAGFVSPRSLHTASKVVQRRTMLDDATLVAALRGAVGEAAARDMEAFINYQDQLPRWDDIVAKPDATPLPETPGASAVLVYGAVARVTKESINPVMQYLKRMPTEWQAVFATTIAKAETKQAIAFSSKEFASWIRENADIL